MSKSKYVVAKRSSYTKRNKSNFVREHVLVAEQKIGRQLKPGETVHHIDHDRSNNNPDNLIVFATNADHSAFHKGCPIYEEDNIWHALPIMLTCDYCHKIFEQTFLRKYKHIYCSKECRDLAQLKTKQLTRNELLNLLLDFEGNFRKAAQEIGLSDNALRKRCVKNNLPIHSSDYKLCF